MPPSVVPREMHTILHHASLAPSGHNAQPWSVRLGAGEMWIGSDRTRWLPSVDPTNREVALSLGAFVENLTIAARANGSDPVVEVIATPTAPEIMHVALTPAPQRNAALDRIRARRTIRTGHRARDLAAPDVKTLCTTAGEDNAFFFSPASNGGRALAEATLEANRRQIASDDAQEELARWIRWTPADERAHRNGFTPKSLDITGLAGWYVRHFMDRKAVLGKRFRAQSFARVRQQLASYGGWLVITSHDGSVPALIDAGRRCERMWLEARERSIAVHPMSQALEEAPFRDEITRDLGLSSPAQFIIRVSYVATYPDPVSPRMPVSWFVRTEGGVPA